MSVENVRARFLGLLAARLPSYVFPIRRSPVLERQAQQVARGETPAEWMRLPLRRTIDYLAVGRRSMLLDELPEKDPV